MDSYNQWLPGQSPWHPHAAYTDFQHQYNVAATTSQTRATDDAIQPYGGSLTAPDARGMPCNAATDVVQPPVSTTIIPGVPHASYSTTADFPEAASQSDPFYYPPPPPLPETDAPPLPPLDELPPLPNDEPHPPLPPLPPLDIETTTAVQPIPGLSEQPYAPEPHEQYQPYNLEQTNPGHQLNYPENRSNTYLQGVNQSYYLQGHAPSQTSYPPEASVSAASFASVSTTYGQPPVHSSQYQSYPGVAYQQHVPTQNYATYQLQVHQSAPPALTPGTYPGHHHHHHHHHHPTQWYQQGYMDYRTYQSQTPGLASWDAQLIPSTAPVSTGHQPAAGTTMPTAPQVRISAPNLVDICNLLRKPGRAKRPKKMMIILRGLPGSGKSYMAKKIREEELAAGGEAPRIHAIDDYFMTEVEKEIADEDGVVGRKSRKRTVTVMEYSFDAKMEGVYTKSLAKAVTRTIEEGRYPFIIVDAPNSRVDDFRELWHVAQAAGFEVFVARPLVSDPEACHARNTHGRSLSDIRAVAANWEAAPALYTELDLAPLVQPRKGDIRDVDMDSQSDTDSDAEEAAAASAAPSSRWSDQDASEDGKRKRAGRLTDQDILAGVNEVFSVEVASSSLPKKQSREAAAAARPAVGSNSKSSLRRDGLQAEPKRKRVRWPDEEEAPEGLFIGGRNRQLEEVFVLENLGPSRDGADGHGVNGHSFADQVKAEHSVEHNAFRAIMFGHRGGLKDSATSQDL